MATQTLSAKLKQQITRNALIETLREESNEFGSDFKKHLKTNVKGAGADALTQVLGQNETITQNKNLGGDLKMGEEINLSTKSHSTEAQAAPKKERKQNISAALEYHAEMARSSDRINRKESREIQSQINEIMAELQRLVSSTDKVMQMQYADFSVGQAPVTPGKYHVNFFSWVLTVIRTTRQKVEDSGAWLQVSKKKGGVLNEAWKKGNTSVTMSNERQVATQSG